MPDRREAATAGAAIIEPVGGHGGMNFYDFELARGLVSAGVSVVVYTCDETEIPDGLNFPVKLPFRGVFGSAPRMVRAARFVRGLLSSLLDARRRGLRVAHFHFFHSTILERISVAAARLFRFRVVITAHDVRSFAGEGSGRSARAIFEVADAVIAHNAASGSELVETLAVDPGKVATISSGNYRTVAAGAPTRDEARRRLDLPSAATIFLFFGQIKKVKALDLLLEAFPTVAGRFPEARLVIAGKVWKDDYAGYAAQVREAGIESSVIERIRFIPDDEVSAYYAAADVVVLPYRKIYQSAVLLMAMSHGRAVLVSDLPGMTDVVEHDQTGIVFRSDDAEDLRSALLRLASDPVLRRRLEAASLDLMESEYAWEKVGRETADVYARVTGR